MLLGFLRNYKWAFSLYNFFQKKALKHNEMVLQEIGLKKKYYEPICHLDFQKVPKPLNNKITNLSQDFAHSKVFNELSAENQQSLLAFDAQGYSILKGFYSASAVDQINAEVDRLLNQGVVKFRYVNKLMFAVQKSEFLKKITWRDDLKHILGVLLRRNPLLFQSINFIQGSEQATHSDSIHMTTYPQGNLIAVWIALEDVAAEQGALHYYPMSHLQPYFMNEDFGNVGSKYKLGDKSYTQYEQALQERVKNSGLEKKVFVAQKGDVLIWHANLWHGGEPHTNKSKTRKSMALHFFAEGVVKYHEFTQRPALMEVY